MNTQFKKGILEMIVLMIVSEQDIYGYELVKRVCEVVPVSEGTIYPLLKRMTSEQYFDTYLKESKEGPPRKYYHMTDKGTEAMYQQKSEWHRLNKQINRFIDHHPLK